LIYDLELDEQINQYQLKLHRAVHTAFEPSLNQITTPEPGELTHFLESLQDKLYSKLESNSPPDAPTLDELL
jgi:hypothetical protein